MPSRNNSMIRRDINRLAALIANSGESVPALNAVSGLVNGAAADVNSTWKAYQSAAVQGDREREERESAINVLVTWIQHWRPVILMLVPGAGKNLRTLPSKGATPDDVIRVAEDMADFMRAEPNASEFFETAEADLGDKLDNAKKETNDAAFILPDEMAARDSYSEACIEANSILVRCLHIVRSAFGSTSPEYKQFIARESSTEEEDDNEITDETAAEISPTV
ncbi:MAG: hypothetical protein JW864_04970 [Spirochaetes bacterium]|nr:hypothetical protein [Spirochaetota bacterium]